MDKLASSILDVGCGPTKRPDAVGIDKDSRSSADVIHDLNIIPYPFADNSFDHIYCDNVLEHLDDITKVMTELHRIGKPGCLLSITVPFFSHRNAYTDPTHKHFFGIHSFDYFLKDTKHSQFHYAPVTFELQNVEFNKGMVMRHWFDRAIVRFANRRMDVYEHRLAHLFPLSQLTVLLKVVKG